MKLMHNPTRHFVFLFASLICLEGWSQKEVVSAYNANKEGDYAAAVTYIEQAIDNPKANVKNKTWRYRGDIYLNVSRDSLLFAQFPNALTLAKESYLKAQELDTKGSYSQEIKIGLGGVQTAASNEGIGRYSSGDFGSAGAFFDLSAEIAQAFEVVDTMAIYNAALCYEKADQLELAVARYEACADIGYQIPNVYLFISNLYRNHEMDSLALETLSEARKLFPREQGLIIEELNIYLTNQEFDKAQENLILAAEQDPTNEILWFSLGSVQDELGETDAAIENYRKALEIAPDHFDSNYNLGALFYNEAVVLINEANDIWARTAAEKKKVAELKEQYEVLLNEAKPYLEKAHEVDPNDQSTMVSLREIYVRKNIMDKAQEMGDKIKALSN